MDRARKSWLVGEVFMEVPCYGAVCSDVTVQLNWPNLCIPDCCTCVRRFRNCCNLQKHGSYYTQNISWLHGVINGELQGLGGTLHQLSRYRIHIHKLGT